MTTMAKYLRGILFFVGLPLLFFIIAGDWGWWQGWVYIAISYLGSILSRILMAKAHPDLLKERADYDKKEDTKKWDKVLMPLVGLILPAAYFITAGFDKRLGWTTTPIPLELYVIALVICLTAYAFSIWALVTNRFFSAVVRIQTDRGHTVVDTGPYHFVRHPGYLAGIVVALTFPLMVGTLWAFIPVGLFIIAVTVRTALEDKTLQAELPGYKQYTQKTRYRLIPGIW